MFFITTFNNRLFNKYAHTFINSYIDCKHNIPLVCYVEEDVDYPHKDKIKYINLYKAMPELTEFKERHKEKNG